MTFKTDEWRYLDAVPHYILDLYRAIAALGLFLFVFFGLIAIVTGEGIFGLLTVATMAVWVFLGLLIRRSKRIQIGTM